MMYKMTKVVYRANDNSRYFLTLPAAQASGMKFTKEYIPIREKSIVPEHIEKRLIDLG